MIWKKARFQSAAQLAAQFGLEYPKGDMDGVEIQDEKYVSIEELEKNGYTFVLDCHMIMWKGQANPYLYRYGAEDWEEKIVKVSRSGLTRVCCVTELIKHIDLETKKAYKGTPFEKTYVWTDDALSQMI